MDLASLNARAAGLDAAGIIRLALEALPGQAVVSTNFRPGEAAILHLVTLQRPEIPVLWADHGYNTDNTYRFAERLITRLTLQTRLYIPRRTRAHREAVDGDLPQPDTPTHAAFTEEVKIEPFRRGLSELRPAVWFTALRRDQTAFRAAMQPFVLETTGLVSWPLVKVCPILDWDQARVDDYLRVHDLPDEHVYFDPTKVGAARECGLHPGVGKQR